MEGGAGSEWRHDRHHLHRRHVHNAGCSHVRDLARKAYKRGRNRMEHAIDGVRVKLKLSGMEEERKAVRDTISAMKEAVRNRFGGKQHGEARPKENPLPVVATPAVTHLEPKPKPKNKNKPKRADTYATTTYADGYPALLNDDYCDCPSD